MKADRVDIGYYYRFQTDEDCAYGVKSRNGYIVRVVSQDRVGTQIRFNVTCPAGKVLEAYADELQPIDFTPNYSHTARYSVGDVVMLLSSTRDGVLDAGTIHTVIAVMGEQRCVVLNIAQEPVVVHYKDIEIVHRAPSVGKDGCAHA